MSWRKERDPEMAREMMLDGIRARGGRRDGATAFVAPEEDQKWRARNVIRVPTVHGKYRSSP
jgi:hypothetical protein